jgi:hypothetical protein
VCARLRGGVCAYGVAHDLEHDPRKRAERKQNEVNEPVLCVAARSRACARARALARVRAYPKSTNRHSVFGVNLRRVGYPVATWSASHAPARARTHTAEAAPDSRASFRALGSRHSAICEFTPALARRLSDARTTLRGQATWRWSARCWNDPSGYQRPGTGRRVASRAVQRDPRRAAQRRDHTAYDAPAASDPPHFLRLLRICPRGRRAKW